MSEYALLHAIKTFREGHDHLNGKLGVFNEHQSTILDTALRFHTKMSGNYKVVSIVIMQYESENPSPHYDLPIAEVCRWDLNE